MHTFVCVCALTKVNLSICVCVCVCVVSKVQSCCICLCLCDVQERRSLIEAMLAATNGNPNQPACDLSLTCGNSNHDPEGDSLTAIDHWDSGETPAGSSLPQPPDDQGAVVLAGNVAVGPTLTSSPPSLPATHFAPFPQRGESGRARPPYRDKTEGGPLRQQQQQGKGDGDRGQQKLGHASGRHNVGGGGQDCVWEEQHPPYPHPHQQGSAVDGAGSPPSQHLRKSATSSPRQPATSQLRSPGHRYLATSPLPPPPPPPPPPSPPPSPPFKDNGASFCTGVGVLEGRGESERREGGLEESRESHREGGVTFPPQPSLPQSLSSSSSSHQAAAAALTTPPAAAATAARSREQQREAGAPPSLSPPAAGLQPHSHPQC